MFDSIRSDYRHTIRACYLTYIVQAIIVTIQPLLFVTFSNEFGFSLEKLALLTTFNFFIQLIFDILCTRIVAMVGYRKSMLICMSLITLGLVGMDVFPYVTDPFAGLLMATVIFGAGGGISEVLVNPIVLSCPSDSKEGALTLLHSFFCWGQVLVVLGSTAFFTLFGTGDWRLLVLLWTLVPVVNLVYYALVPMNEEGPGLGSEGTPFRKLFAMKMFWLFVILMLCGGAAEHAMSQWASDFAETALGVSKTVGDLTGLCAFCIAMGISRTVYGRYSEKINLYRMMFWCTVLCLVCYGLAAFSPLPLLALAGCAVCGFSVGIYWPGIFGMAERIIPIGGTSMFALLSLAGDIGCMSGPTSVGFAAAAFSDSLSAGLALAMLFPAVMIVVLLVYRRELSR